jgi:hypothetical protein
MSDSVQKSTINKPEMRNSRFGFGSGFAATFSLEPPKPPNLYFGADDSNMALKSVHGKVNPGNAKGGNITVPLTSCLTGLDKTVLQIKTKIVSSHTADS